MKRQVKQMLAAALCLVMVISLTGTPALAAEHIHDENCGYSEGSPCTHTTHDETCGYAKAQPDSSCTHVHDENCGYTEAALGHECNHEHGDGTCHYSEGTPEIPCTCGLGSTGEEHGPDCPYLPAAAGTPCDHVHQANECTYLEPTDEIPCSHTHDENCGFAKASPESPCKHEQAGHDATCGYTAPSSCTYVQPDRPVLRATGWVEINGIWYFHNKDGSLACDEWKKSGNQWFYLAPEDGHMVVDELILYDGNYYYADSNGARVHNTWAKVPNEGDIQMDNEATFFYFYMGSDGKAIRAKDGEAYHRYVIYGKSYFFDHIGRMLWGILPVDDDSGDFYYLSDFKDGAMVTGWQWLAADLFPAAPDGASKREDGWYYFRSNGKAQRGKENSVTIKRINGKDYGFGVDGRAYSGWVAEDGTQCLGDTAYQAGMYYFEPADAGKGSAGQLLKKSWLELNGNRFYFDDDGKKLHNVSREIDKTVWKFDQYGVAQTGDSYSIPVALRFYPNGLDGEGFFYEEDIQRTLAVGPTDLKVRASAYPAEITVAVQNADGGQSGSITYTRKGILAARNNTPKSSLTIPAYPGENGDGTEQWMTDWSDGFTVAYVPKSGGPAQPDEQVHSVNLSPRPFYFEDDKYAQNNGTLFENAEDNFPAFSVGDSDKTVNASDYPDSITVDGNTYERKGILTWVTSIDGDSTIAKVENSITIPAYPQNGNEEDIKNWTAQWGDGITLAYVRKAQIPDAVTYNMTVHDSYAQYTGAGSYAESAQVTIDAGTRKEYTFIGWDINGMDTSELDLNSSKLTFDMPATDVTATAKWKKYLFHAETAIGDTIAFAPEDPPPLITAIKAESYTPTLDDIAIAIKGDVVIQDIFSFTDVAYTVRDRNTCEISDKVYGEGEIVKFREQMHVVGDVHVNKNAQSYIYLYRTDRTNYSKWVYENGTVVPDMAVSKVATETKQLFFINGVQYDVEHEIKMPNDRIMCYLYTTDGNCAGKIVVDGKHRNNMQECEFFTGYDPATLNKEQSEKPSAQILQAGKLLNVYTVFSQNITPFNSNGDEVSDVSGEVTITVNIPRYIDTLTDVKFVGQHIGSSGYEEIPIEKTGSQVIMRTTTKNFSPFVLYAVAEAKTAEIPVKTLELKEPAPTDPPAQPTTPTAPTEQATAPTVTTSRVSSSTTDTSIGKTTAVNTGDETDLALWMLLAVMSGGVAMTLNIYMRKEKRRS